MRLFELSGRTALFSCFCWGHGANSGILWEPIESFVAPQLSFHPIERTLLCQTIANCFRRFATVRRSVFEFVSEFFVVDVDVFSGSDAVDNQFCFNIIRSALLLPAPQRDPIDIYGPRISTLRSQGADHTLEAHIHLMLHE